jgi:hypothetical protein
VSHRTRRGERRAELAAERKARVDAGPADIALLVWCKIVREKDGVIAIGN